MSNRLSVATAGVRLHQFVCGALPVAAYLSGWLPPVWVAAGLSLLALVSERLALVAYLLNRKPYVYDQEDPGPYRGLYRLDEGVRLVLLGAGLGVLGLGEPLGWMPILAAASTSILEGTTAFSFILLLYAAWRAAVRRLRGTEARTSRDAGRPDAEPAQPEGNPYCLVCRATGSAPYGRCRWCRLRSIRWCCGLQTSLLLVLLMVIAFLLSATLEPLVTKLLVAMSIVGVVALSLAITQQTNDLIVSLNGLEEARRRLERRCNFLQRLTQARSVEEAAETTVDYVADALGARRVSVMLAEGEVLRIVASRGVPTEVAEAVAVPIPHRISGRVFESGRPVVFEDPVREGLAGALGLKVEGPAMASLPMVSTALATAGRRVGVINVTDRPAGPFGLEDLEELQFVAEAAAISLAGQLDRRDLERNNYAAIRTLAQAIEAKDPCTHGHSLRVQRWATAVGWRMGLSGPRLRALAYAAELHDIGKIAVPDAVLDAPRRLTDAEWTLVREHPRRGAEMVRHLGFLAPARAAILHHHERMDGRGYPDGLRGEAIPLEARILAVVDAYDAMTSARPYRPPMTHEEAAAELQRGCGTQFDPRCVEVFLEVLKGGEGLDPEQLEAGMDRRFQTVF